ncbi:serine hydrolase domain-containing protein [Metabacillus halosaccharovorans]|uniref:serine hydrolase domain-containing protein n=1 Tax=Metabacillus halosaccharovorans TaxID=930124 RepID=UPI00204153A7|nr:serine hydrolase domain-containing protein [Metabacillus halosaccharovorans]MCM3439603.1 beta-lactamase family protein [Metabacillus halosaccharovorans]
MKTLINTKKLFFILLLIILVIPTFLLPAPVQAAQQFNTEDIDKFITNYMERNGLPGASIVVVKDGKLVYEQGYGHDSEGEPITENSLMRIGSTSKSFTSFAVVQLVDEGKIGLDDPVVKYLPEIKLNDTRWKEVTIRQLMSHTSGIPNPVIVPPASNLKAGVERLNDWKLKSNPGEKHYYSNANYWLLARLVEEVTGIEFSQYLKQKIFSPLGMGHSLTTVNSTDFVQGLSKGYVTAYGTAIPWTELEAMNMGAGSIISTASDMGKWLSMHTNEGKNSSGQQLLSKELLEESYKHQPGSEKYGLGWSLSSPGVKPSRISHSGAVSTYQTQQDIVPSSGYAVAVLLNSFTPTLEHAYEISSGIIQLTEGQEPESKAPSPKIIDLSLGVITLIYLLLGIRGIVRSKKWSDKRNHHPTWRFILRLIPQLNPTLLIGWLFFIVPTLQNNSSTTIDAFGLYPAAMFLLAVVFIIGLILTILRIYHRITLNRD